MTNTATLIAARKLALTFLDYALSQCDITLAQECMRYLVDCDQGPGNSDAIDRACAMFADHMLGVGTWELANDGECAVRTDRTAAVSLVDETIRYIHPSCELGPDGEYRHPMNAP